MYGEINIKSSPATIFINPLIHGQIQPDQSQPIKIPGIRVSAYKNAFEGGVCTRVKILPGDILTIRASGSVCHSSNLNDSACPFGPDGHGDKPPAVLPTAPHMALIGKISTPGDWFFIGNNFRKKMGHAGMLYLAVNDDIYEDNLGYFHVEVEVER